MPQCATCQFFSKPGDPAYTKQIAYGICVRFPQPVDHHEGYWCGEFKERVTEARLKEPNRREKVKP